MKENIAHYTKFESVFKILESKKLWATNFQFLNDTSEIHYAKTLFRASLRHWEKDHNGTKTAGETEKLIDKLYTCLGKEIYITSFCEHSPLQIAVPSSREDKIWEDDDVFRDEGLLSMWRGYGKEGGCAIVFDREAFDAPLIKKNACEYLKLDSVKYERGRYEELAGEGEEFFEKLRKLSETLNDFSGDDFEERLCNEEIWSDVLCIIPFFKHHGFHEENEIRLVVVPDLLGLDGLRSDENPSNLFPVFYREDGAPYVTLNYAIASVKKIVVGPHVDQTLRVKKPEHFTKNTKGFTHIEVVPSRIPFLG